jgi:hypothetical protein
MRPALRRAPLAPLLLAASFAACAAPLDEHPSGGPRASTAVAAVETEPPAPRAPTALERVLELGTQDNRVQAHAAYLALEIGPRLTGSKAYDRSAEWCLEQFRSWGLDARLEKWGELDVAFDRGVQRGRIVAPVEQELVFLTQAWTRGTDGPVRGPALLEPADEAGLAALKGKLAGAWLVRRAERPKGDLRRAIETACEAEGLAGYVAGARGELLVMSGNPRVKLDALPAQVRITLRKDHFDGLTARLEGGEALELEFELEHRFTPGPVPCFNVVADLRGSEAPDEYVIVGAHLDSWDGAQGAQDNATGVATTMEAARLLAAAGVRPRRTVRFVLFGGEEQGLFGSEGYVRDHKHELARTSVVLIHDAGGTALQGIAPDYRMFADFQAVFAPFLDESARFPFEVRELDALVNSGDSDHAPFLSAGVPAFFWEQSEEGYTRVHHTQYDTFDTIDPAQQEHSARVVAVAALGFANLDHLLDRGAMEDGRPPPRRRIGVQLEGTRVVELVENGKAKAAGVQAGDVLTALDGVKLASQEDLSRELQRGGSRKTLVVRRGEAVLEFALDWSGDEGEAQRLERARRREEWRARRGAAGR